MLKGKMKYFIILVLFIVYFSQYQSRAASSSIPRSRTRRIVGGELSFIEKYPWQVRVFSDGVYVCGGSIINKEFVLTGAHCVNNVTKDKLLVRDGNYYINGGNQHEVEKAMIHPDFQKDGWKKDIAILQVTEFTFNIYTQRVLMRNGGAYPLVDNIVVMAAGYGSMGNSKCSGVLQEATLLTVSYEQCQSSLKDYDLEERYHFCVQWSGKGQKGFCDGDEGGGVVTRKDILLGVMAVSNGCGKGNKPQICIDISHFRDWIYRMTGIQVADEEVNELY